MKVLKLGIFFGIMTMLFNSIWFTLYDKVVEGGVNPRYFALTSLLGFLSGISAYYAVLLTGAQQWIA